MEGQNQLANEILAETEKMPINKDPFAMSDGWVVGAQFKITGGKYKKYKTGTLVKKSKTYSDVCCVEGTGPNINVKVKNCYLLPVDGPGIEMPDENDLVVVENLPPGTAEHLEMEIKEIPQEEFKTGNDEIKQLLEENITLKQELLRLRDALSMVEKVINFAVASQ